MTESFQMGLDALAPVGEGRWLLFGWVMRPRGEEARLSFLAADGRPLPLLFEGRHPRPDVCPARPDLAEVDGFHLVFAAGEGERGDLRLQAEADGEELRVRLGDPSIPDDLAPVIAARGWAENLSLLADARRAGPLLAPLFTAQGRSFGVFQDWVARVPELPAEPAPFGSAGALGVGVTMAGDIALALRPAPGTGAVPADSVRIEAFARPSLPAPASAGVMPLCIADWQAEPVGEALLAWGRVEPWTAPIPAAVEVLLEARVGGEGLWARCRPTARHLVGLFDPLAAAALGPEPTPAARAALRRALGRLLARREAAVRGMIPTEWRAPAPSDPPPLLLLTGIEEELGVRLIEALAPLLAEMPPPLLLSGPAAQLGQLALEEAGIAALVGDEAEQALEAAGSRRVAALALRQLAEAVIDRRLPAGLGDGMPTIPARDLLLLHRLAGPGGDLEATRARLAGEEAPPQISACPEVKAPLSAHLEALWRGFRSPAPAGNTGHG
ncbi:MAG: hypothetical protein N3D18_10050 [Roseococcus sp.]|nr:hypothetical protein [Roseococcus sp.]